MNRDDAPDPRARSWANFRRIEAQFLRPHRAMMAPALVGLLAQSILLLPVPLLQGWIVDRLIPLPGKGAPRPPSEAGALAWAIALALVAMIACHLARLALGWKVAAMMSRITLEVVRELTDALHRKLQRLAMTYFDRQQTGQIMARLTGDVGSLLLFLNGGSLQLVSDLVLAVGIGLLLVWLHWTLALACFVTLPLYAVNHRLFSARIHELARGVRGEVAALYALLSERVSAVRVVRSFAKEDAELAELDNRIDAHRALGWASIKAASWQGALATLISGLGTVLVVAYGAVLVGRGRLTVGELLAFYTLVTQLYNPILRLAGFQAMLAATLVAVDRIVEVIDEPETIAGGHEAGAPRRPRGGLVYQGVSFAYRPGGRPVLDGIDLEIEPGMTIGLLGASGSGKSTLLALAPRIYDLEAGRGSIRLDGRDVRDLKLGDLRRALVLVPQRAMLFEGTIRSNLTYAAPGAGAQAIRAALETADLAALVDALPMGLETPVGERGQTLSGGQRQRLALARALAADPAVLLLDDCTSALDAETEARIQDALWKHGPDRTRVIVSHKVSSVRDADRIVVLDAGRIAEMGCHDELIRQAGLYAGIYRRQTESLLYGPDSEGWDRPPGRIASA